MYMYIKTGYIFRAPSGLRQGPVSNAPAAHPDQLKVECPPPPPGGRPL